MPLVDTDSNGGTEQANNHATDIHMPTIVSYQHDHTLSISAMAMHDREYSHATNAQAFNSRHHARIATSMPLVDTDSNGGTEQANNYATYTHMPIIASHNNKHTLSINVLDLNHHNACTTM